MQVIENIVKNTKVGEPVHFRSLTLYPLYGKSNSRLDYVTLDEALSSGCAEVREVSDHGTVPELTFVNRCERHVLLLDGEELIGAKQNRVLNLTILAPAKTSIVIPVSCVEAGRWNYHSSVFKTANRAQYARGRARKAAQVSESLRYSGSRRSDQGAVWRDISEMAACLDVKSTTDAMADIFNQVEEDLAAYVNAFKPAPGQNGGAFVVAGQVVGVELFDRAKTLEKLFPKLIRSYALDAVEQEHGNHNKKYISVTERSVETFLQIVATSTSNTYDAVGMGKDVRILEPDVTGAALLIDDTVVHLCAFANESGPLQSRNERTASMIAASGRRRRLH